MTAFIERSFGVKFGTGIARLVVNSELKRITRLTLDISKCGCLLKPSALLKLRKEHLRYLVSKTNINMSPLTLSDDRTKVTLSLAAGEGGDWGTKLLGLLEEKNIELLNETYEIH